MNFSFIMAFYILFLEAYFFCYSAMTISTSDCYANRLVSLFFLLAELPEIYGMPA